MKKECYQVASENLKNALTFNSFKNFWILPLMLWRLAVPLTLLPPLFAYGLAAVALWVRNAFKAQS